MKLKIIIGILFLGLIVYLFLALPRQVSLEMKGIAFSQTDPAYTEDVSIKIDGQINNLYFGARGFTGQIYCKAIGLDGEYFNLLFDDTNKSYLSVPQKTGKPIEYGEIFADEKMDELVIVKGDNIFVFPSENREAAKKTADEYFAKKLL
jgi:hypothetical protein